MKKLLILSLFLTGCGYSSKNNEVIGQVKRLMSHTPIICPDYSEVDFSMGIMKNGTGSVSKEDIFLYVPDNELKKRLLEAASSGIPTKITYDIKRLTFCVNEAVVRTVEPAL